MHDEEIFESWQKYNEELFGIPSLVAKVFGDDLPYIFQKPHCNTCVHWKLLNAEALHHIAISSPNEYDEIIGYFRHSQV